jgi:hypothetical protein
VSNPTELPDEYRIYWTAFIDLISCRPPGGKAMIPWTAIQQFASTQGIPVDELKTVIWSLDHQLREWWKAQEPDK